MLNAQINRNTITVVKIYKATAVCSLIKFSSPILPGTVALLEMKYDRAKPALTYTISDFTLQKMVYSTGTFEVHEA